MHIAASNPLGIRAEDVPAEVLEKEREIYRAQALESGKPENVVEKIVEGRVSKFFKECSLMDQPYVRNPDMTVADLLNEAIAKIGENITVKRFVRFQIGES
jgi:elongation factor Ts